MKNNKIAMHYVPQMIIDMAENAKKNESKPFLQDTYLLRLESIRDYCDQVIEKLSKRKEAK